MWDLPVPWQSTQHVSEFPSPLWKWDASAWALSWGLSTDFLSDAASEILASSAVVLLLTHCRTGQFIKTWEISWISSSARRKSKAHSPLLGCRRPRGEANPPASLRAGAEEVGTRVCAGTTEPGTGGPSLGKGPQLLFLWTFCHHWAKNQRGAWMKSKQINSVQGSIQECAGARAGLLLELKPSYKLPITKADLDSTTCYFPI